MITLRHHVITVVSVFLALAVGVVLGSGPLSEVADRTDPAAAPLGDDPATGAGSTFPDGFVAAVAPTLVADRLKGQEVAVVTVPGADEQVVTALVEQVSAAGGSVTARYALSEAMLDPSQKSLVDTLGSQLMTQLGDSVSADASTYDRMGQLLGLTVGTTSEDAESSTRKARSVAEAVAGAGLMAPVADDPQRAPLVLFVLGADTRDESVDAILSGLLGGLSRGVKGVVAAGSAADGGEGQLGRFRADPAAASVATVDGTETMAGKIATVMALARSTQTAGGSFGASGADGPAPLG
ncbi:copper transporter [Nocardioides seonyuensis]|uniref:copper transporter n=1 Tax=Nocardioides seonyuensis TaxID=2518371 RepID=UPI00141FA191|nr:copper transporter [Nocardioides seonyuensis]